ncbi:MAG: division/cell wall cluster transcriptional repressor MraZ [Acidobacteriota bacterium]
MFRGNLPTKVDAQGRIKIPAAHRKTLEELYGLELFVTSIRGDNVLIYPLPEWEKVEAKLLQLPKLLPSRVNFQLRTSYFGQVATMDRQGRVVVQPHLRESAGINGSGVSVMGQLNHLEVWNTETVMRRLQAHPFTDEYATELSKLDI